MKRNSFQRRVFGITFSCSYSLSPLHHYEGQYTSTRTCLSRLLPLQHNLAGARRLEKRKRYFSRCSQLCNETRSEKSIRVRLKEEFFSHYVSQETYEQQIIN